MTGNPPLKKKSRFFENGKSKIGNLLHPLKKKARKDGDDSPERDANEDGRPLLANIQPFAPFTLPPKAPAPAPGQAHGDPSTSCSQGVRPATISFSQQHVLSGTHLQDRDQAQACTSTHPPTTPQDENSEAETEHESDSDDEEDDAEYNSSDEENTKPGRNTRRERRKAIYGAEALLPPGSGANIQASHGQVVQKPSFMGVPIHTTGAPASPSGPGVFPFGRSYYFSGVPTNANVTATGGQHTFNFQTTQAISMPSTMQQSTYNLCQHPSGFGLARFAQETAHTDTGPLSQRKTRVPTTPNQHAAPSTGTAPRLDVDRDQFGRLIPAFKSRPPAHHGIRQPASTVPAHLRDPDFLVPENMYTSPQRIERAQHFAQISLKRKRPDAILPPPSYVYQHSGSPSFNIFHGFLLYPELCFALAAHLPVKDLVSLYAISKDFHVILDSRFTTVILSQAMRKAPESARTFMFRSYANLCRNDPAARIPHPNAQLAAQGVTRKIPSFRWLKMVLHREKVIHEIMAVFAEDGIPLPARCSLALKRIWFMLDIPDNARRIGYSHARSLLTDLDLYFLACFFVKVDMRLNDPVSGEKKDGMRKILLAQRSLTTVLRVLKREMWTTRYDILREWVRLKYEHPPGTPAEEREMNIFGVPANMVGRGKLEYWGLKTDEDVGRRLKSLLRPDQLIVREAFRRGMRFDKHYLRFLLYGYIRPDTLEDYAPRTYGRRIEAIKDDDYEIDAVVGGVAALDVEDEGFDPLLDLGPAREVSRFTIVKEKISKREKEIREREEEFLDKCVGWWKRELEESAKESDA